MNKPTTLPSCCGLDSIWVDNVPGKEYSYCTECKQEVGEGTTSITTPPWLSSPTSWTYSPAVPLKMVQTGPTSLTLKGGLATTPTWYYPTAITAGILCSMACRGCGNVTITKGAPAPTNCPQCKYDGDPNKLLVSQFRTLYSAAATVTPPAPLAAKVCADSSQHHAFDHNDMFQCGCTIYDHIAKLLWPR